MAPVIHCQSLESEHNDSQFLQVRDTCGTSSVNSCRHLDFLSMGCVDWCISHDSNVLTLSLATGHTTAAVSLAAKIVRFRPAYVTCIVAEVVRVRASDLLDSLFLPEEEHLQRLVRYVDAH